MAHWLRGATRSPSPKVGKTLKGVVARAGEGAWGWGTSGAWQEFHPGRGWAAPALFQDAQARDRVTCLWSIHAPGHLASTRASPLCPEGAFVLCRHVPMCTAPWRENGLPTSMFAGVVCPGSAIQGVFCWAWHSERAPCPLPTASLARGACSGPGWGQGECSLLATG